MLLTDAPLLALSGNSRSGKSVIALRLASALESVSIIHLDDFYFSTATDFSRPSSIDLASALTRISYERAKGSRLVIVEGIFALTFTSVRNLAHLRVYVDAPMDICLARKTLRTLHEGQSPQPSLVCYLNGARESYLENVCTYKKYADIVVDGTQSPDAIVESLIKLPADPSCITSLNLSRLRKQKFSGGGQSDSRDES